MTALNEWTNTNWPGWGDQERRIQIENDAGVFMEGALEVDDWFSDGESEIPVFCIVKADGTKCSFADNKRWRFIDEIEETR